MAKKIKILKVDGGCIKQHVGQKVCKKLCAGCRKTLTDMYKRMGFTVK